MNADVLVKGTGRYSSLFLLTPQSDAATAWIAENIGPDATWWCGALVVEHRYVANLIEGMRGDGLEVRIA